MRKLQNIYFVFYNKCKKCQEMYTFSDTLFFYAFIIISYKFAYKIYANTIIIQFKTIFSNASLCQKKYTISDTFLVDKSIGILYN